ncbi:hypothetical protein B5F87_06565 [Eubacterium sp. An3]|nr:hypothetical protein B5F87_06565 [Eubacterium sp. An3]
MSKDINNFTIILNKESRIQLLIIYFWIYPSIITYGIVYGCRLIGFYSDNAQIVIRILTITVMIIALQSCLQLIKLRHIFFYLLMLGLYLFSYKLFPENSAIMDDNISLFFLAVLPLFFLGTMIDKVKIPYETLGTLSYYVIILFLISVIFLSSGDVVDHDMGKAYDCLPSVMLVSFNALKKRRGRDFIFMALGVILLLLCATRGPILLYAIFMILQLPLIERKYRYLYIGLLLAVIILFISPLGMILVEVISLLLNNLGFSTRIIDLLLTGDLTYDNGRNWLYDATFAMIEAQPWRGNGIFSDRRATGAIGIGENGIGIYVHNIIYEFWCDFGYILGTALLVIIAFGILKTLKKHKTNINFKVIFLIFVISYMGKLFMSSSFLIEPGFWLCIGVCFEGMRNEKRRKM